MSNNTRWWSDSSARIELQLTLDDARGCSHPGPCDADVAALADVGSVHRQLSTLDPDLVREVLREYGAWSDEELASHPDNLLRLLWVACCDLAEEET